MRSWKWFLAFIMLLSGSQVYLPKASANDDPVITKKDINEMLEGDYSKGELLIKFKTTPTAKEKEELYVTYGLTERSIQQDGQLALVSYPNKQLKAELIQNLLKNENISYAEPNYQSEAQYIPVDTYYRHQWYLPKINLPKAWNTTRGSTQITVAVIDGGMDIYHSDLRGKIYKPFNAVTGGTAITSDPHGTHVGGIIAATMNKSGVAGIAPNVKLMPIDAFVGDGAETYDVVRGIYYAVDNGADIINMSLGGYSYSYAAADAIQYAESRGVLVIAAAGNEDTNSYTYPAAYDGVIGVSATDQRDVITDFSNYGDYISISAPGSNIYSTLPRSNYGSMDGTSMAAPVVSGVAALMMTKNPLLTLDQIKYSLLGSSVDLGNRGWDYFYGYGRVDANRALNWTSEPIVAMSMNASNFHMTGANKLIASCRVNGSMRGSVFVVDSKGKVAASLIRDQLPSAGRFTSQWNGMLLDNKTYAPSGKYTVVFRMSDGKQVVSKTMPVNVVNKVASASK